MFDMGMTAAIMAMQAEVSLVERARKGMTPEAFSEWRRERIEASRHDQLCRAIRDSRPRGFGVFW